MSSLVAVEGLVTQVEPLFNTFLVEPQPICLHNIRVFSFFLINQKLVLPKVGTKVKLKSPIYNQFGSLITSIIVPEDGVLEGDLSLEAPRTEFLNLLKKLDRNELLQFVRNFSKLEKHYQNELQSVLLSLLKSELHFEIDFLENLKYVDEESCKDFSYYTFGVHRSGNLLAGVLSVGKDQTVCFKDATKALPCVFLNRDEDKLVLDCFIILKDFTFVCEIYTSEVVTTIEYLLIDAKKLTRSLSENQSVFPNCKRLNESGTISCKLLSKSQVVAVRNNVFVFWLEFQSPTQVFFLRLSGEYLSCYHSFQRNRFYEIHSTHFRSPFFDQEVGKFARLKYNETVPLYDCPSHTSFKPTNRLEPLELLTVSQALTKLSESRPLSFEGRIALKLFTNPLPSRTAPNCTNPNFGTPGFKTHKLVFGSEQQLLELYLNNWENLVGPLGLLPEMRVRVYNVVPQNRKYLKSTIFTSIEVASYEPEIEFETANLFSLNCSGSFYLGAGRLIPTSTIIWGRVETYEVLKVKFVLVDKQLHGQITISMSDMFGEAKISAKNEIAIQFLKVVSGYNERDFRVWISEFAKMQPYSYVIDQEIENKDCEILTLLNHFFASLERPFFAKCRKMNNNEEEDIGIFFLLDVQ